MDLPVEIRERTVDLMIENTFRTQTIIPAGKEISCRCPRFDRDHAFQSSQMKSLPSLLGQALGQEFWRVFFRKKEFRFRCACELLSHLEHNARFRDNVRHVVVHWCGPESANAFKAIPRCLKLESLSINISKSTLVHLNARAALMRSYFPLAYRNIRMSDVLGLDELLEIRGLRDVQVFHVQPKSNSHEMDRACLWDLLSNRLTLPPHVPPDVCSRQLRC